ncbi:MAG: hypothetical protein ACI8P0_004461 [Planctomycetaceae bacterium]|jgi:hypothetical protein
MIIDPGFAGLVVCTEAILPRIRWPFRELWRRFRLRIAQSFIQIHTAGCVDHFLLLTAHRQLTLNSDPRIKDDEASLYNLVFPNSSYVTKRLYRA